MKPNGFTLLELLVALAVFGFLLAGLSQTLRFGLAAWRTEARLDDGKTDLEAVDRGLRTIVQNLQPGDDAAHPGITGTAATMTGVSLMRVPGSGLAPVLIEAGLAVSGDRLVLRWRPYHHGEPLLPAPPPEETTLMAGVSRMAISYWRRPGIWVPVWKEPDLPLLVRFNLTFTGEHPPRWPDVVAAPRLSRR
jgi:general secretion pathway protein J